MVMVKEEKGRIKAADPAIDEKCLRSWLLSETAEDFGRLVPFFERRLIRLAVGMVGDFQEAQQIVQEAFLRAFRDRRGFRGEAAVGTWLSRITAHLCLDYLKHRRWRFFLRPFAGKSGDRAPSQTQDEQEQFGEEGGQYENVWQRELRQRLRLALEKLPPRQKSVFFLLHVDGLSVAEIGEILGMESGTVKVQAHRARRQMRELLADLAPGRSGKAIPIDENHPAANQPVPDAEKETE